MPVDPEALLRFEPDDDGWLVAHTADSDRFVSVFRSIRIRNETATTARIRFETGPEVRNVGDAVHGGYLLAAIDQALFMACRALDRPAGVRGVTLDTSCQFIAPMAVEKPLEGVVEILRETGRLMFLRGTIEQDGVIGAAFMGTIRKAT